MHRDNLSIAAPTNDLNDMGIFSEKAKTERSETHWIGFYTYTVPFPTRA